MLLRSGSVLRAGAYSQLLTLATKLLRTMWVYTDSGSSSLRGSQKASSRSKHK